MASNAQFWIGFGPLDGVIKRGSVGHQRGAGQNSITVRANNSLVDARGVSEIIRVEN